MGQPRCLGPLASEDGVGGPRRGPTELGRRDPTHTTFDARLLEDRLGELGPRAVALRGHMPDPLWQLEQVACRLGEMAYERGASALVVDDRDFLALGSEGEHRADKVLPGPPEEPGAADDPAGPHLALALELRAPVHGEWARLVRLDVGLTFATVEDVIGREVDDRRTERDDVPRPGDVHPLGALRVGFRPVHVRPGRRVQHEARLDFDRGLRDVELVARACVSLGEDLGEGSAELPAGPGDQDAAWSRSDRIGDFVLQRSTTRGSSQGTSCSSGSAGSYSSVTW